MNMTITSSRGTCSPWEGSPALIISSSSHRALLLRVFMLPISTTIELDAKAHHNYTLLARYKNSKKESDS